jgi:hypothetical protein
VRESTLAGCQDSVTASLVKTGNINALVLKAWGARDVRELLGAKEAR